MADYTRNKWSNFEAKIRGKVVSRRNVDDITFFPAKKDRDRELPAKVVFRVGVYGYHGHGLDDPKDNAATQYFDVSVVGWNAEDVYKTLKVGGEYLIIGMIYPAKEHAEYGGWEIEAATVAPLPGRFQDIEVEVEEYKDNSGGRGGRGSGRSSDDSSGRGGRGGGRGRGRSEAPAESSDDGDSSEDFGIGDSINVDGGDADPEPAPTRGRGRGRGRGRAVSND